MTPIADRVVNIVSMIYGVAIGAPALACAILARELLVAAMLGVGPEPLIGAVRFLGFLADIPLRVVTAVIVLWGASPLAILLIPRLYWTAAGLSLATVPTKLAHIHGSFAAAFHCRHRAPLIE